MISTLYQIRLNVNQIGYAVGQAGVWTAARQARVLLVDE